MNKRMKDIKDKTKEELTALLAEKRESLRTLRFSAAGARPKDPSEGKTLRADIARILTVRNAAK
ncbi:MAG: 50S ribosomal protein L29 [Candidatus Pacebacteria bacterium]|nr:50S ribosomal protein L29 [Candidatus Paceibacterota bacterium]MBP9840170.1 50S ribosomal protein L29 [Candidatus Paceibacterota bacterium]